MKWKKIIIIQADNEWDDISRRVRDSLGIFCLVFVFLTFLSVASKEWICFLFLCNDNQTAHCGILDARISFLMTWQNDDKNEFVVLHINLMAFLHSLSLKICFCWFQCRRITVKYSISNSFIFLHKKKWFIKMMQKQHMCVWRKPEPNHIEKKLVEPWLITCSFWYSFFKIL